MRTRPLVFATLALVAATTSAGQAEQTYTPWSTPVNLGPVVNTPQGEFFPTVSKDGLSLYFSAPAVTVNGVVRPSLGGMDIYVTRRLTVNDPWGTPENVGEPINSFFDDVAPMLSNDGHLLFFSSTRPGGIGGSDIYASWRRHKADDFGWEEPENLGVAINTAANESGPFLFEDDETGSITLYFDSSRPEGPGPYADDPAHNGNDIYASRLGWHGFVPAVLVPELSTPSAERKVAISRNGRELVLSSNRPGRIGTMDLWVSTRQSSHEPWPEPVNMGATINGGGQQSGGAFSWDGLSFYFNADKVSWPGQGKFDLLVVTRERVHPHGHEGCVDRPHGPKGRR